MRQMVKYFFLTILILSTGYFCYLQFQDSLLLFPIITVDVNTEKSALLPIHRNFTQHHFILTIQCMLLILLPMYINMFFGLFSFQEIEPNLENSLKCTLDENSKTRISSLLENIKMNKSIQEKSSVQTRKQVTFNLNIGTY